MPGVVVVLSSDELGVYALSRAQGEARKRGVPLVIAASVSVPHNEAQASGYANRRAGVEATLAKKVAEIEATGLACTGYIPAVPSEAADAALEAAKAHEADLIVVGLRRRSPVGKLVLGSMSQDILLGADCDVLGVKLAPELED